jgi:putative transposase
VLRQFSSAHRWTYNQCVASQQEQKRGISIKKLRAKHVNKGAAPTWAEATPYDIREDGVRDFKKAMANDEQKVKKSSMKFRSLKRDPTATFAVRHRTVETGYKCARFYPRFFAKLGVPAEKAWIRTAEQVPTPASDCRIQWQRRTGHWFICVPMVLKQRVARGENQAPRVVALDPGVRAFQTLYDPQQPAVEQWGEGDQGRIIRLCEHLDALESRISRAAAERGGFRRWAEQRRKHVRRLRRAAGRMRQRIRNLVDDLHHHLAAHLVDNYALILLPVFFTSEMVPRKRRKIRRKTVRSMLTWSHYRFQQFLLHKARSVADCQVVLVCEGYTSKCCSSCGAIHTRLGGAAVFRCPGCGVALLRDANGARGILLRFLSGIDHKELFAKASSVAAHSLG